MNDYTFAKNDPTSTAQATRELALAIEAADAILIGAGAGISTAAGMTYTGERFKRLFGDFEAAYGFHDMYSGGFYPFPTPEQTWSFWSRYIWCNRYQKAPNHSYEYLLDLVKDKDYFILTTNVDHQFQLAGFVKERMFYTQGDYGLWQCSVPCHQYTYDNYSTVQQMVLAQGFEIEPETNELIIPEGVTPSMSVPTELVPRCPICGKPETMNLRSDGTFVEDEGWHAAARRYHDFLNTHRQGNVLYLELGVGYNTPGIIKYPFWQYVAENRHALYACLNLSQTLCPKAIEKRSILINDDIEETLENMASLIAH